ncbi:MAG: hypothetical protein ACR2IE_10175 [Candidatus Sumerlaeaceae bacterium]
MHLQAIFLDDSHLELNQPLPGSAGKRVTIELNADVQNATHCRLIWQQVYGATHAKTANELEQRIAEVRAGWDE